MKKNMKKKGFTLIELIVVIAILGILAAVLIPKFTGFQDKARNTQAITDAKQIATAIDSINAEKNTWPVAAVYSASDTTHKAVTDLAGITITTGTNSLKFLANGGFTYKVKVGDKFYSAERNTGTDKVVAGATTTN